jgi:hypothetical protein
MQIPVKMALGNIIGSKLRRTLEWAPQFISNNAFMFDTTETQKFAGTIFIHFPVVGERLRYVYSITGMYRMRSLTYKVFT